MRIRLLLLILVLFSSAAFAATDEVDTLAKDFEKTKKTIEQQELKQRQILSALYQINKKVKKIVTEKSVLVQEKAFVEASIRTLTEKVTEIDTQAKAQKTLLAERLKAIYQLGGQSLARLFMSSVSSSEMERNLKIMGIVAERDLNLIKDYTRNLKDLQTKKVKLAGRLDKLKQLEGKISVQEKNLVAEQNMKNKILDGVRRSKLFALNKISSLREKSLRFNLEDAGLFDLLFHPSFSDQKGQLPRPLEGVVASRFGLEKSASHPYTLNHKGIVINASYGQNNASALPQPIKSVFEGVVSFVGELPGFGKTLIIDHGDHYYTVYSHAKEFKVKLGEEVTQSQTIAMANNLYFEIRHFSEPYDPQQWMKGFNL